MIKSITSTYIPEYLMVELDSNGLCYCKEIHIATGFAKGKMMCLALENEDINTEFDRWTKGTTVDQDDSIYVDPACKLPRDLIRNSGYKIVRDAANADKVVVPRLYEAAETHENFVLKHNPWDRVYMVTARHLSDYITTPFTEAQIAQIINCAKESIKNKYPSEHVPDESFDIYFRDDFKPFTVYYVKKCQSYAEMFKRGSWDVYITDIAFPRTNETKLNPELLEMLARYDDNNMFEKLLLATDWQNYPLTVNLLLKKKGYIRRTEPMNIVLNAIDFEIFRWHGIRDWCKNRVASPDDWNLAQRYMMSRFNLDLENGGFMFGQKGIRKTNVPDFEILRMRLALKPYFITEPTPFSLLLDVINNS